MSRILILRPEPGASASAARAEAMGLCALRCPLFAIEPLAWDIPDAAQYDSLLLTSANAVRHAGRGLSGLRSLGVIAVGEKTAEAARSAGLTVTTTGDAGVAALLDSLPGEQRLLHLGAEEGVAVDSRHRVERRTVYRAVPIADPALPSGGYVALVHSPRAGARLAELVADRSRVGIAAISPAAAQACGDGWRRVESVAAPSDGALLALAAQLCKDCQQ